MMRKTVFFIFFFVIFLLFVIPIKAEETIRVGYFPNITHSQAVIGIANGAFQKALGDNVKIETKIFNAGPSVIEAIFAGALDLAYVGPNPAINGYIKSDGKALRIIAGATSGGAALVVRLDAGINKIEDFHRKRIASPQLGNTQDVFLRAWLRGNGFLFKENGGDVEVVSIANPDQLTLFLKKEIDAAWTVEPWVSRLVKDGKGKIFIDEASLWPNGDFVTTHVIVTKKFLEKHPEIVKNWIRAHVELTRWINNNPNEAKAILNQEIKKMTGQTLSQEVLDEAFSRIKITYDPIRKSLFTSAQQAFEQGFLGKEKPDLSGIYALDILNEILKEKNLPQID